jgi:hypothetical protein
VELQIRERSLECVAGPLSISFMMQVAAVSCTTAPKRGVAIDAEGGCRARWREAHRDGGVVVGTVVFCPGDAVGRERGERLINTDELVARRAKLSLWNSRALHVAPFLVVGAVNVTIASVRPLAGGVCVLLRYFHAEYIESDWVAGQYNPTQSVVLPGPFATRKVIVPPGRTGARLAVIVGGDGGLRAKLMLVVVAPTLTAIGVPADGVQLLHGRLL